MQTISRYFACVNRENPTRIAPEASIQWRRVRGLNRDMKALALTLLLVLLSITLQAGVLFTYNSVNVSTGVLCTFRLDTSGGYELLQAITETSRAARLTNHVVGVIADVRPILAEVKEIADNDWLIDAKLPSKDHRRTVDTGEMVTLLLITYNDAFVEMRPLTAYTNLLHKFDTLILACRRSPIKSTKNEGIILAPACVETFNECPLTVTDPYACIALPNLNAVLTEEEYNALRKGGQLNRISAFCNNSEALITSAMTLTSKGNVTLLRDLK
jgi:hypothetical protein